MLETNVIEKEVLEVIRTHHHKIFMAEKKVADFILENPEQAVDSNVAELAKLSGVSNATVIRMCHHLGYSGYYQFRITLARDLGRKEQGIDREHASQDAVGEVFKKFADEMMSIGDKIDTEEMWNCVNLLKGARNVHVIAVGCTGNISQYMGFRLERMGIRSTCSTVPEFYIPKINLAEEGDVLVAISKSGISKQVIKGMELAKEKGLKMIAITSAAQSPVSELADYVLCSGGQGGHDDVVKRHVYFSEFAVVEALLSFVMNDETITKTHADMPELIMSDFKL